MQSSLGSNLRQVFRSRRAPKDVSGWTETAPESLRHGSRLLAANFQLTSRHPNVRVWRMQLAFADCDSEASPKGENFCKRGYSG